MKIILIILLILLSIKCFSQEQDSIFVKRLLLARETYISGHYYAGGDGLNFTSREMHHNFVNMDSLDVLKYNVDSLIPLYKRGFYCSNYWFSKTIDQVTKSMVLDSIFDIYVDTSKKNYLKIKDKDLNFYIKELNKKPNYQGRSKLKFKNHVYQLFWITAKYKYIGKQNLLSFLLDKNNHSKYSTNIFNTLVVNKYCILDILKIETFKIK